MFTSPLSVDREGRVDTMAMMHPSSCEALRTELNPFSVPCTQTVVESSNWVACLPLNPAEGATSLEFHVSGAGGTLLDPSHTLLYTRNKITNENGTDIAPPAGAIPAAGGNPAVPAVPACTAVVVNNFADAQWSQVSVSLNGKLVSHSSATYPHRAYLDNLLNYDTGAKDTHMAMRMWYKDTAGHMETFVAGGANEGANQRRELTALSKPFETLAPLHTDIMNQDKALLNGVDMDIKLTRSRDAFMLMSTNTTRKVKLLEAILYVRKITPSASVLLGHAMALEKTTAKYPIKRVETKSTTISAGVRDKTIDNLHIGQVPDRMVVGFTENVSFNGAYDKNPYNFQHFNANHLSLDVDSRQYPAKPLTPDFANGLYMEAYNTLFAGSGIHWKDVGNDISFKEYPRGYTLYCFDLTPDLSANEAHWNLKRHGTVRLNVRFAEALPAPINCITYSEFRNMGECDKNRNFLVDFTT